MNSLALVNALRRHRDALVARWCRQFASHRGGRGGRVPALSRAFVAALFDEVVAMIEEPEEHSIPRRHPGRAFAEMAAFPENVAVCIDVFQAGAQVLGAFVVERSGPNAMWSTRSRNAHLGELDAVFHILVHREIEAVCEVHLVPRPVGRPCATRARTAIPAPPGGVPLAHN